jgi:DNA invertase Pin-like site-specific DNA recombinase
MNPRIAIYSRVSTDRQTTESQMGEINAYCQRRGWENAKIYEDIASGAKTSRNALDRLMADVRRGRVDAVVSYKLDRLGRSLAHLAQILGEFQSYRVALICTSQGIDTSLNNPAAQLQLHVLMAVAEFERSIIRERVCAGVAAAKARGQKLGRPEILTRYLPQVRELLSQGKGTCAVARELKLPLSSASKLVSKAKRVEFSA